VDPDDLAGDHHDAEAGSEVEVSKTIKRQTRTVKEECHICGRHFEPERKGEQLCDDCWFVMALRPRPHEARPQK
jgi:hypothetical protein